MKHTLSLRHALLCTLPCLLLSPAAQAAQNFASSPGLGSAPYVTADQDAAKPKSEEKLLDAVMNAKPFVEMRYRYEYARQTSLPHEAHANTLRTIAGFQTAPYQDFRIAMGFENMMPIGSNNNYNDGLNGLSKYPRIGDPRNTQLQLANLQWFGLPQTTITGGRQYLVIDNQRWIGTSNWRQIRQNFDAATIKNGSVSDLELLYSHIFNVNRSAGTNSATGTYHTNTDVFHATYTGIPELKLSAYTYLMDIDKQRALSSATAGLRAEVKHPVNDTLTLTGVGEYARQSNYASNLDNYSLNYYTVEPGFILGKDKGTFGSMTGKVGYEVLGSNGAQAVQTPQASLHNQNGWADMFGTTPNAGLRDFYVSGVFKYQLPWSELAPTKIQTDWHSFYSEKGHNHYGNEFDLGLSQLIHDHYTLELQYAVYRKDDTLNLTTSSNPNTNTHKIMLIGMMQY